MLDAGVPDPVGTSNAQAFALIADGNAAWTTYDVTTLTGSSPRSLHAFIADHVRALGRGETGGRCAAAKRDHGAKESVQRLRDT